MQSVPAQIKLVYTMTFRLKRALIVGTLALIGFPVLTPGVFAQTKDQLCAIEGSSAAVIMRTRQMGLPLAKSLEISGGTPGVSREMILEAYDEPRWSSKDRQDYAVTEFENKWLLACLRR